MNESGHFTGMIYRKAQNRSNTLALESADYPQKKLLERAAYEILPFGHCSGWMGSSDGLMGVVLKMVVMD